MRSVDTILFDWDGTLLDSEPLAFRAFQKTFLELGIPLERELYERIYSPNWYGMYQQLGLPEARWQDADDLWIRNYGHATAPLVHGGREAVCEFKARGFCLGIVTSGSRERVRREVKHAGLEGIFKALVCNEDVVNKKPHPEGLEIAMRQINTRPDRCSYVGDSPVDVEMGKRAGMQTIGIIGRYPSSRDLPKANPDFCFDSIEKLLIHFHR
jgi:beta-phosphoglucomutase-like phosphatase (HAD superfamily)